LILAKESSSAGLSEEKASFRGRWPELDGLRGAAILMVFLLHYVTDSRSHEGSFGLLYHFAQIFRLGWSGVDLFFVLSGFLIGGILLDARSTSNVFRTFYTRRIHRILPVYYVLITIYLASSYAIAKWNLFGNAPYVENPHHPEVYFLFLQNIVKTPPSLFYHYLVSPTWSLAVEEQFYLLAPFLIRYLSLRRLTQVLSACVVFAPILRYCAFSFLPDGVNKAYVLMPCRADTLAMGILAAIAWRTKAKAWLVCHSRILKISCGVLLVGALAMIKWLPVPRTAFDDAFQYSWIGLMYTCVLLIALIDERSFMARVARWRFLRAWGRVSYCFYLVHLGALGMCHWILFRSLPRIDDWQGFGATLLAATFTWTVAQASWKYFEKPLIDRGHALTYAAPPG
jgi:peptidoglycan/LPS O-acetylase OafA/YrhL